jgi:UDP-3-O-[3-hydroxymyristoyl] N-acetylglucosamine deacetylase
MSYVQFRQHTIGEEVCCRGVGLHSGKRVSMRLKPAPKGHGIRFRRIDIPDQPTIPADYLHVVSTCQATTIGFDGVVVSTIEHLMAAFFGSGIDNALIELDGPEVPIFDGSAATYLKLLKKAGAREQQAARKYLSIERPVLIKEGDSFIKASPSDRFQVRYVIEYPHPLIGKQELSWSFDSGSFRDDIARARTFGFLKDVRRLQNMGLARGGSLANAVIFGGDTLLNVDGFRYADECVRHKILDLMGDLALTGMFVLGSFEVRKAGHGLHSRFLKHLMAGPDRAAPRPAPIPAAYVPAAAAAFLNRFPQASEAM